jgi:hypothetical protein
VDFFPQVSSPKPYTTLLSSPSALHASPMEERPPIWRVAAIILNKQSRTTDKGWPSSVWVGRGANNSSLWKRIFVTKYSQYPDTHFKRLSRSRAHGIVGCHGKNSQWHPRDRSRDLPTSSAVQSILIMQYNYAVNKQSLGLLASIAEHISPHIGN